MKLAGCFRNLELALTKIHKHPGVLLFGDFLGPLLKCFFGFSRLFEQIPEMHSDHEWL